MHPPGSYVGLTQLVQLPRPGNGEMTRPQIEFLLIGGENHRPGLQKTDFNPFVSMGIKAPILGRPGIPKTDAIKTRQDIFRHGRAGIMAFGQGIQLNFPLPHRPVLWLATVNFIPLMARLVGGPGGHRKFNILRRTNLQVFIMPIMAESPFKPSARKGCLNGRLTYLNNCEQN